MSKKIVFFDIDGTLVDCVNGLDYLTDYTKRALKKLKDEGHYIFIASGRPYGYLLKELLEFNFDGYILCDGAYILFHGKEIGYHPIDKEEIRFMFEQAKNKNMTYVGYDKKYAYFFNDDGRFLEYSHKFNFNDQFIGKIGNYEEMVDKFLKIHICCRNDRDFKEFVLHEDKFNCANDNNFYLKEIYSKQYNKATALKEILDYTGLNLEDSYFFGDGLNDIEMMGAIGHAIAMDNAVEEVKSHADYICKSVSDDGVADFIFNSGLF
ncbi:MAG: HAD family hydrolase [Bacilli bacterium]|nr:HAD family hydrolase [Bacilli bacterium]